MSSEALLSRGRSEGAEPAVGGTQAGGQTSAPAPPPKRTLERHPLPTLGLGSHSGHEALGPFKRPHSVLSWLEPKAWAFGFL